MNADNSISIGYLALRTGMAVTAVRFYETRGLLSPSRNSSGQRRFHRADIRRLSFVRIAQQLGLSIDEIVSELSKLPQGRAPTAADWRGIASSIRALLDARITLLARTRDLLDGCIGCGCLSLKHCALYNPKDSAGQNGAGPRYVLGDKIPTPRPAMKKTQ